MQTIQKNNTKNKNDLLSYLTLMTIAFITFQLIFIVTFSNNSIVLSIALHHNHIHIPWITWSGILFFILVHTLLYLTFVLTTYQISRLTSTLLKLNDQHTFQLGLIVWGSAVLALFLANQLYFPNSIFSQFTAVFIPTLLAKIILFFCLSLLLISTILALLKITHLLIHTQPFIKIIAAVLLITTLGSQAYFKTNIMHSAQLQHEKPNIILIGLDAVRPDRLDHYGYSKKNTPSIDTFLAHSTCFSNTLTPLARTSPAWVSILTGQYPKHSHARFNLTQQSHLQLEDSLETLLKQHGYQTLYASDDSRFNNITPHFGFDQIMTPPPGINDFLLGSINDFPLSNLIINTPLGARLFPYSYANRGADITYQPSSFIQLLDRKLTNLRNKPLFLAMHLCLAHHPFTWSSLPIREELSNSERYDLSLAELDRQFNALISTLKKHHALDNAIVILLSDHGEALDRPGDRMIDTKKYVQGQLSRSTLFETIKPLATKNSSLNHTTGHGTDILSYTQQRSLLAFQLFGQQKNIIREVPELVSLIDIKPTLLSLLGYSCKHTDGESLQSYIEKNNPPIPARMIFTETGFTPTELRKEKISIKNTIYQGIQAFQIEPETGRIIMKPELIKPLLSLKQRAVFYREWCLALYSSTLILVNRETHAWTDDLTTSFARHSPAKKMLIALHHFYGDEITL